MRIRKITLLVLLALVAAACGGGAEDTTTSTSGDTTTTEPPVEAQLLTYALASGDAFEYEVDMNQTIDMTSSGDTSSLGEGDELPGEASISIAGTSAFLYTVAEGPEAGTFEITINGDFSDLEFSGTVDGEPVDSTEIPDMADVEPVDVTIVVDEQGNVIPEDTSGLGGDLFGGFSGLDMLGQLGPGGGGGDFIGPPFTDDEVTVGDTWSETVETPVMPGIDPITTQVESEVVATDSIDGSEVFVIETTTTTSPIEFDLAEFLIGMMSGFMPEEASEEDQAQLDAIVDQLRFVISVDESVSDMTTWFDPEAGVARQAEVASQTHMVMDVNIPDETTGDLAEFALDMSIVQDYTYRLTDSSEA